MNARVTTASASSYAFGIFAILLLVVMVAAPWWAGRADIRLLSEMLLYLSLACLWNLLAGYAGLVSVGQQAYVGLGGYLLFSMAMFADAPPLYVLPLIGLIGALVSIPVAAIIFRLRGAYFAIGTWVIAEVFRLSAAQVSALGGGSGTSLPVSIVKSISDSRSGRDSAIYWCVLALAILILAVIVVLLRSRQGIALKAIRDNELAASSLGISTWRTKFMVYVITAGLTSMVGAMIFLQKLRITPDAAFSVNDWTAFVIFIVVIGGIGTLEGPIIGTLVFFLLRETLADLGSIYLMILGAVAIIIMLYAPQGVWGFIRARYKIELFPITPRVMTKRD